MQNRLADLNAAGIQVVAISYDSPETLKAFADKASIRFPLLSDADSRVIDAYGIRHQGIDNDSPLNGIPHPGTFLIDKDGRVRAKLFHDGYKKRHTPDDILKAKSNLSAE